MSCLDEIEIIDDGSSGTMTAGQKSADSLAMIGEVFKLLPDWWDYEPGTEDRERWAAIRQLLLSIRSSVKHERKASRKQREMDGALIGLASEVYPTADPIQEQFLDLCESMGSR